MAEHSSKDLLELEAKRGGVSSTSNLESLFVCKKDPTFTPSDASRQKPTMAPLPKSQYKLFRVMGSCFSSGKGERLLRSFIRIEQETDGGCKGTILLPFLERPENYDIEVISGDESKYIEMDLMLGIADLHTPEAVAAAESAMAGYQPPARLEESSSGSEDEDSSDDEEDRNHKSDSEAGSESAKLRLKAGDSSCRESKKRKAKIIEL
ncbi:hypothetical protein SASPL_121863 [Salvia splendens]|uniref:Uncharacterized protein n=1 Tax=Salvia splendens TaxID=180675 RepID=A0A8X8XY70_SALSN|nr:hypothetical protein SASPL_121863 [Salvia splendens]